MTEFPLLSPTAAELARARRALDRILERGNAGEIDLPPYLARLLVQLRDVLGATRPRPR